MRLSKNPALLAEAKSDLLALDGVGRLEPVVVCPYPVAGPLTL